MVSLPYDGRVPEPPYRTDMEERLDEAAAEIARLREALEAKERECAEWKDIAECMTDPDPCSFDHHGYCQAHGWFYTDPKCPHERAKAACAPATETPTMPDTPKPAHAPGPIAPTPWFVDKDSVGAMWTDSISVKDARGGHVARLTRGYQCDANGDGCPSYANAALISATPDMLAALKAMHEYAENNCYDELDEMWGLNVRGRSLEFKAVLDAALAAIAKAEGK